MTALPESDSAILAELRRDSRPSQREQCADWCGIPLDDVGEDDLMRWLDWLRDCEEMGQ